MAGNRGEGAEMEGGHPLVAPGGQGLKKGPWTAAEDAVLTEYVRKHGEGNWNSVQKNTGLMRCGKSCRLRWANHLRPNLKKGAFSPEEERIIIELHAKFGNKWARMASQLPGRTDNEIKNYWNTRMKRRQRANLPLYPDGVRTAGIPQQGRHQHHNPQPYSLSSSPLQPQQVSLTQKGRYGFDPSPLPFHPGSGFPLSSANALHNQSFVVYSDPNHQFLVNNLNLNFSMPFSASSSFLDRNISSHLLQSLNLPPMSSPGIFDGDLTGLSALIAGAPFDDSGNESSTNKDLPSSQYQSFAPILTPSSSSLNSNDFLIGAAPANSLEEYYDIEQPLKRRNSGLLDSLAEEAKAISPDDKKVRGSDYNGKRAIEENQYQSFLRPKSGEEIRIDSNHIYSMDEDLSSLLVNFPCSMPKPDWYHGGSTDVPTGEASSSALEGSTAGLDACNDVNAPPRPATAPSSGYDWKSRTSCWMNMPGIH